MEQLIYEEIRASVKQRGCGEGMSNYLLGIDNGGTSVKAMIFDEEGKEVALSSMHLALLTPHSGYVERDLDELWSANCYVIRDVIKKTGINSCNIKGVSLSGHGKGLYLIGRDNKPAYNGITSMDARAYRYPQVWREDGTADFVYERTYQKILACQQVSLLRWLKDNRNDVFRNIRYIFGVKDIIRFMLTGEAYADITDFSGSNLVNIKTGQYDIELLKRYGLEEVMEMLPPLKYPTELCGTITKEASALTGLKEGTPVAAGMFDIDACAIAMNIVDENRLCVIAGTWSINEYISKRPVTNKSVMMNSLYCLPGYYLIEESSPTSASNLEWFINMFLGYERKKALTEGINLYAYLDESIGKVKPDEQDIIFLPYIFGSNYDPASKAALIGMGSHHTKEQITRAVYEGIVFSHKVHIDKLLQNREKPKAIRLAGGAANSAVWVQIFADVLNLPIEIIDVKELGAFGAAMAAGVVCGLYESLESAADKLVKMKYKACPNERYVSVYMDKFERYKKVSEDIINHQ